MNNSCTIRSTTLKQRLAVLCVIFSAIVTGFFWLSAFANTAVGLGQDEQQLASELVNSQAWPQQHGSQRSSPHKLGIQTLSIELDERKKSDPKRRARVYQFNYQLNQSRLVLIDLESAIIVKQQVIKTVHLPLNAHEIATAKALVEQQTEIMDKIHQSQSQRGMPPSLDLSTIDVKASIFEPDNPQHVCAKQRCALISLFDQTRTVFTVEPLVNLQSLNVSTLQSGP